MSSRRAGGGKRRKLAVDNSDEQITADQFANTMRSKSTSNVLESSQSSELGGYRDLFGELVPFDKCTSTPVSKNESVKKTPRSRKKPDKMTPRSRKESVKKTTPRSKNDSVEKTQMSKRKMNQLLFEEPAVTSMAKLEEPNATPLLEKVLEKTQNEITGAGNSSKQRSGGQKIPDYKYFSINEMLLNGIRSFESSRQSTSSDKSLTIIEKNDPSTILEGVYAFVDYKLENDRNVFGIVNRLIELGAKIQKTFNNKVTHVVFREGSYKTYNTALQRNIPLVSARWVEGCKLAKRMVDPQIYPCVQLEKYKTPKKKKKKPELDITDLLKKPSSQNYKKFLTKEKIEEDKMLLERCNDLLIRVVNFNKSLREEKNSHDIFYDRIHTIPHELHTLFNSYGKADENNCFHESQIPESIQLLKLRITRDGCDKQEALDELSQIEDRLNLNSQAKLRLRKLLFPLDSEQKMDPIKLAHLKQVFRKSTVDISTTLTSTSNQNIELDKEVLLRDKKIQGQKTNDETTNHTTEDTAPSTSILTNNSSMTVQNLNLTSIAFTGMKKWEAIDFKMLLMSMGSFLFHSKVKKSTTFLIAKPDIPVTLDMVYAMAYGCYIVSTNWILESLENGEWLPFEPFLISDLYKPVKEFQIRRHSAAPPSTFRVFNNAGYIFVEKNSTPSTTKVKELIRICGGRCTNVENRANIKIRQMNFHVSVNWVMDSIIQGTLLDIFDYTYSNLTN